MKTKITVGFITNAISSKNLVAGDDWTLENTDIK